MAARKRKSENTSESTTTTTRPARKRASTRKRTSASTHASESASPVENAHEATASGAELGTMPDDATNTGTTETRGRDRGASAS